MGIGDWGLGIGPNPQSPIPNPQLKTSKYLNRIIIKLNINITIINLTLIQINNIYYNKI